MASSVIGALRVNLGLDSAKFSRGMTDAQKRLKAARAQFLLVAGAAAAFGTALTAAAMKGAREIDRVAKAARRLDTSIAGFRAMELAAGEAGVSMSSLTNDVQTMNRELANIGKTGNAQRALDALGLSIDDLSGKEADQQLAVLADRIVDMGLSSGETTAILRDLGVRNREMVLALMGGGEAFRRARSDVEDYGLAVSAVDASRIEQANDAIGRLSLISTYLGQQLALAVVPALGAMAEAMTDSLREGGLLRAVIDGLVASLGFISRAFVSFAAFMGGRYVVALVAARVATFKLAGALTALRVALLRSGLGILVVAAGELIYQLVRLVEKAGAVGAAFVLLKDVAVEAWSRIKLGVKAAGAAAMTMFYDLKADAASAMSSAIDSVVGFGNTAVNTFTGAYEAIKASWSLLPEAIGDLVFQAANAMISGVETMLNAVVTRINNFISTINSVLSSLPKWATGEGGVAIGLLDEFELGRVSNPFSGGADAVASSARDAFNRAFEENPLTAPDLGLADIATDAMDMAASYRNLTTTLTDLALAPMTSVQALRDAVAEVAGETDNATGSAAALSDQMDGLGDVGDPGGGSGGGGAGSTALTPLIEDARTLGDVMGDVRETFKGVFTGLVTGAKSLSEAVTDLISKFAEMLASRAFDMLWDAMFPTGGGLKSGGSSGGIGGFFRNLIGMNATGTDYWRGGLTSVNERGGEIMNLPRGTQIIPHDISKRMADGSGTTLQVHIHENAVDGQTQVKQSGGRIDVLLRREMSDLVRGGGLDSAIGQRFGMRPRAVGG